MESNRDNVIKLLQEQFYRLSFYKAEYKNLKPILDLAESTLQLKDAVFKLRMDEMKECIAELENRNQFIIGQSLRFKFQQANENEGIDELHTTNTSLQSALTTLQKKGKKKTELLVQTHAQKEFEIHRKVQPEKALTTHIENLKKLNMTKDKENAKLTPALENETKTSQWIARAKNYREMRRERSNR
jgi:hypothetical protein